jgi:uncharacterized protein (TIGR02246 family)
MAKLRKRFGLRLALMGLVAIALAFLIGTSFAQTTTAADLNQKTPPPVSKLNDGADDKAIRATAEDFVKAFNAGDAGAVAALWAPDAEYTDAAGRTVQGRSSIEKIYADLFKQHRGATIALTIKSIRFPLPSIALEKGVARLKLSSAGADSAASYTVLHVKRDGKWTMAWAQDASYLPESNEEALKDLDWLIGEWKVQKKGLGVRIKFEWMPHKSFIKKTYTVTKDGQSTVTGVQMIGWNPKLERIVSWHFDPLGGFGTGVWGKDGQKWVINSDSLLRGGGESNAVNVLTPIDANSFNWESVKRTVDGVSVPDKRPVKVMRVQ